jgi:hypothetical protein
VSSDAPKPDQNAANILRLAGQNPEDVTPLPAGANPLPDSMQLKTDAEVCSAVLQTLRDMFAGLHYGIEVAERDEEDELTGSAKEEAAARSLDRCHGVVQEALRQMPEELDTNEISLHVGKALAEDFLCRVDPVLNPDEDGETE